MNMDGVIVMNEKGSVENELISRSGRDTNACGKQSTHIESNVGKVKMKLYSNI